MCKVLPTFPLERIFEQGHQDYIVVAPENSNSMNTETSEGILTTATERYVHVLGNGLLCDEGLSEDDEVVEDESSLVCRLVDEMDDSQTKMGVSVVDSSTKDNGDGSEDDEGEGNALLIREMMAEIEDEEAGSSSGERTCSHMMIIHTRKQ